MVGSASPAPREELTLFEFQLKLLDEYDLTEDKGYDAATEEIADYDSQTAIYTLTNKELVARMKKNQISDSEMRDLLTTLKGAIFTTFKMQDGRRFVKEYTRSKTWRRALQDFRKQAAIPSLEPYTILHDGEAVSNKGPPRWGPGNFEFDVMCRQGGGGRYV